MTRQVYVLWGSVLGKDELLPAVLQVFVLEYSREGEEHF